MSVTPVLVALAVASSVLVPAAAEASTTHARAFSNCTQLNKVYRHGVGRVGARDKTSGVPVTTFTRNTKVYDQNKGRDRDKDGIACEKR